MRKAGRRPAPAGDEREGANLELADPGAAGGIALGCQPTYPPPSRDVSWLRACRRSATTTNQTSGRAVMHASDAATGAIPLGLPACRSPRRFGSGSAQAAQRAHCTVFIGRVQIEQGARGKRRIALGTQRIGVGLPIAHQAKAILAQLTNAVAHRERHAVAGPIVVARRASGVCCQCTSRAGACPSNSSNRRAFSASRTWASDTQSTGSRSWSARIRSHKL